MDLSFRSSADPDRSFEATRGLYQVFFDKSTVAAPFTTFRTQSGAEIRFRLDAMAYYDRSTKNHVVLSQAADGEPSDSGNRMTFSEVFPGVDVRYEYTGTRLKEEILFSQRARQSLPDPTSLGFRNDNVYLAFLTRFEVDSTFEVFSKNIKLGKRRGFDHEGEDRIDFRNPDGKTKFFFPLDFAYFDRGAQTDSSAVRWESKKVLKRLISTEAGDFLFAAIPLRWLQKLPAGPVVIDPTIAVQPDAAVGKDNFIYQGGGGNDNYGANGGLQVAPDQGVSERRGLVKFDVSDIPGNATIVNAELRLFLYSTFGTASSFTFEAHKMLVDWVEGTASAWNNNSTSGSDWVYADEPNTTQWNANGMQSGTDYSATVLGTVLINRSDDEVWKTVEVTGAVQDWVDGTSTNYGLALTTISGDMSKYIGSSYRSSDYSTDPSLRPKLVVTYTFGDLAEYNYTPSGAINSVTFNSGDSTYSGVFEYQERDWVTNITYKSESDVTLFDIDYIHDDIGNIDSLSYTNLSETDNVGYDYDKLNRLKGATSSTHNDLDWTYDKNGNIKTKQVAETQTTYDYTYDTLNNRPNRLTDFEGTAYVYDSNGNINDIGDGVALLQYDYKNQLEFYEGTKDEYYDYDAAGRRVYKEGKGASYGENFNDNDVDDGDPTDWYKTGSYWSASNGELKWTSSGYSGGQCSNPDLQYDDFVAEFEVMADGYFSTSFWAAFAFRKTNYGDWYGTSGYMVYYRYNGWIYLYEAGVGNLASSNTGKDLSTWRDVKIEASGSTIKVYVDGNLEINKTDGTYTNGYFGFNVFGVQARLDNLTLYDDTKVYYVRDVNGDVLAEYDFAGNLAGEYVYANGQRITKLSPAGTADIYLNDHLGSARAMTASSWSANYYPFGEVSSQTGSDFNTRFDFTGQERDQGTGLMYYVGRYYDPVIGRWISPDPLAEEFPSLSPYNYAANNPLKFVDPDGRFLISFLVAVATFLLVDSVTDLNVDEDSDEDESDSSDGDQELQNLQQLML